MVTLTKNGNAARKLCRKFGIKLVSNYRRLGERETWCRSTIERLIRTNGEEAMVLTLRVLTETHPNNLSCLNREVITAVNSVCCLSRWTSLGMPFLEAWDPLDLGELHKRALSYGKLSMPLWVMLYVIITDRLRPVLDPLVPKPPPKPAKGPSKKEQIAAAKLKAAETRIVVVEKQIALGLKLLELKSKMPGTMAMVASAESISVTSTRNSPLKQLRSRGSMASAQRYFGAWVGEPL